MKKTLETNKPLDGYTLMAMAMAIVMNVPVLGWFMWVLSWMTIAMTFINGSIFLYRDISWLMGVI